MAEEAPSPARLEAFSDGVIAVIITIMVLEIKVPHVDGIEGLKELTPSLLIYILSFAFTGIYWLNHQHLVRRVHKAEHGMQCANLGFLFALSQSSDQLGNLRGKHVCGFPVCGFSIRGCRCLYVLACYSPQPPEALQYIR